MSKGRTYMDEEEKNREIEVIWFYREDPKWRDVQLGLDPRYTIGEHGGALCSLSTVLAQAGVRIKGHLPHPKLLNEWAIEHGAFTKDSDLLFDSFNELGCRRLEKFDNPKCITEVDRALNLFYYVIAVFRAENEKTKERFFAVVGSVDDYNYFVVDNMDKNRHTMSKNDLMRAIIFTIHPKLK